MKKFILLAALTMTGLAVGSVGDECLSQDRNYNAYMQCIYEKSF